MTDVLIPEIVDAADFERFGPRYGNVAHRHRNYFGEVEPEVELSLTENASELEAQIRELYKQGRLTQIVPSPKAMPVLLVGAAAGAIGAQLLPRGAGGILIGLGVLWYGWSKLKEG